MFASDAFMEGQNSKHEARTGLTQYDETILKYQICIYICKIISITVVFLDIFTINVFMDVLYMYVV